MKKLSSLRVLSVVLLAVFALPLPGEAMARINKKHNKQKNRQAVESSEPISMPDSSSSPIPSGIHFGFNVKGLLNTQEQVEMTDKMFATLPNSVAKNITLRVNGGTVSQKEFPKDWSNDQMDAWINLQKKYGVGLVYVVNGNDTPQSQLDFIKSWMQRGAKFTFIEMMNEYYLPKFRRGDKGSKEVGQKVDAKIYSDEILPKYFKVMATLNLPFFVICAPEKDGNEETKNWNQIVIAAMKRHPEIKWGATIHLYKRDKAFSYEQVSALRNMLPAGTTIAVTEAGILSRSSYSYEERGPLVRQHYELIAQQLKSGDYLFDQVLYNIGKNDVMATLNAKTSGLTPKGKEVVKFMTENTK
jgi:hypothetical protein